MEEVTEADRLLYEGADLTLLDGRTVTLNYGYGGLRKIEKHFGGVRKLLEALQDPLGAAFFDGVFFGILYGLWQQNITEEQLEALIQPQDMEKHGEVVAAAIIAAFPQKAQEVVKAEVVETTATTASNGPSTITSQSSLAELHPIASGT